MVGELGEIEGISLAEIEQKVKDAEYLGFLRGMEEAERGRVKNEFQAHDASRPVRRAEEPTNEKVPPVRDEKVSVRPFTGEELHKGLGVVFKH